MQGKLKIGINKSSKIEKKKIILRDSNTSAESSQANALTIRPQPKLLEGVVNSIYTLD